MKNVSFLKKLAIFSLMLFITIVSCKKEKTESNSGNLSQINSAFRANSPITQTFTVNVDQPNLISGEQGTKVFIPQDAFVDKNGQPVSGNVTINLQEIYSPGDMVLTNKMTTSNGKLLVSGGELYFNAKQNGQNLQIADQKEVGFKIPQQSNDPQMQFFAGVNSATGFNWVPNSSIDLSDCADSGKASYCFGLDSMINWINCDYFYSYPGTLTDVDLQVPSGYDTSNTLIYMYVPSINSVTTVHDYSPQHFWIKNGYEVPVGLNVIFVAIHDAGNNNYTLAYSNTTITNNHQEVLNFQSMTLAQIIQVIQGL